MGIGRKGGREKGKEEGKERRNVGLRGGAEKNNCEIELITKYCSAVK